MKPTKSKSEIGETVTIAEVEQRSMTFNIIGMSPLVPHAMSAGSKISLLYPAPKKNAAEKLTSMKHEPFDEFREAAYQFTDETQGSRLYMPAGSFHAAMASVAIDMVGAKKSQIGRLTSVLGHKIPIFGIPKIWTTVVRSSDMARTPDIRTLPILPEWACSITVEFIGSLIKAASIVNLLGAAGIIIGIGDGRPEKGKLSMGKFKLVNDSDPDFLRIKKNGGYNAQDSALADPDFYDLETERLLNRFNEERGKRNAAPVSSKKNGSQPQISA